MYKLTHRMIYRMWYLLPRFLNTIITVEWRQLTWRDYLTWPTKKNVFLLYRLFCHFCFIYLPPNLLPSQVITTVVDKLRPSKVSFHFYPKFKGAFPTKSIANPMANKSIREQGLYVRRKEQRRRKVKMLECWRWWRRFADRLYWIRECLLSVVAST